LKKDYSAATKNIIIMSCWFVIFLMQLSESLVGDASSLIGLRSPAFIRRHPVINNQAKQENTGESKSN